VHVSFFANITDAASDKSYSFKWDFGNGETSNKQNPIIVYENASSYDVVCRLLDDVVYTLSTETVVVEIAHFDYTSA
jgi:hypothetical protein